MKHFLHSAEYSSMCFVVKFAYIFAKKIDNNNNNTNNSNNNNSNNNNNYNRIQES